VGDADTVMMAAIEAGAEDVESSEDGHTIWCADTDLNEVSTALEAELGESESTKLIWRPTTTTELDLEDAQKLMKLIDALEDDDDVQTRHREFRDLRRGDGTARSSVEPRKTASRGIEPRETAGLRREFSCQDEGVSPALTETMARLVLSK
jgi:hypothetical protein